MLGTRINNFKIVKKLGEGGFGAVYKAVHVELDIPYAVKILNVEQKKKSTVVERFRREAKAIATLSHPNIVRLIDFGWKEDVGYYLIMEFLNGKTLSEYLEEQNEIDFKQIERWFEQICSALNYIHEKGIIHRDIKPANIFILDHPENEREEVKLIDFGIAALGAQYSNLTRTGFTMGSPLYMAPEQAKGDQKNLDHRSDLYSLGVVLFYLLSGRPPFIGDTPLNVLYHHISTPPPKLSEVNRERPWHPKLEQFIQRALAKNKAERPESAEIFFNELKEALHAQLQFAPELNKSIVISPSELSGNLLPTGDDSDSHHDKEEEPTKNSPPEKVENKTLNLTPEPISALEEKDSRQTFGKTSSDQILAETQLEDYYSSQVSPEKKSPLLIYGLSLLLFLGIGSGLFFFLSGKKEPISNRNSGGNSLTSAEDHSENRSSKKPEKRLQKKTKLIYVSYDVPPHFLY